MSRVSEVFTAWLRERGLRKTPERMGILDAIYSRDDHFDAETLFRDLLKNGMHVSRATVYNTLDLLMACNLIRRHQFESAHARFEKAYGSRQHDHLICMECHRVVEFCDPRLQHIQATMGSLLHFDIQHHSLTMYGQCLTDNCEFNPENN